jgi:hypothetical protein
MKIIGINNINPFLYISLFLLILSNVSFPFTLNLISEIEIIKGIYPYLSIILKIIIIILIPIYFFNIFIIYKINNKSIYSLSFDLNREETL